MNTIRSEEKGLSLYLLSEYVTSGHFIQSTFENWESDYYLLLQLYFSQYIYGTKVRLSPNLSTRHMMKPENSEIEYS